MSKSTSNGPHSQPPPSPSLGMFERDNLTRSPNGKIRRGDIVGYSKSNEIKVGLAWNLRSTPSKIIMDIIPMHLVGGFAERWAREGIKAAEEGFFMDRIIGDYDLKGRVVRVPADQLTVKQSKMYNYYRRVAHNYIKPDPLYYEQ